MQGNTKLRFRAGPGAIDRIRREGFHATQVGTIAGASGGAKWLVLSHIDRVIASTILPQAESPLHLIGSSIGAWRFACYAQADPLAAIERFEQAYLEQSYSARPGIDEISDKSREILATILGQEGAREIVGNPRLRLHVMTVRARSLAASERPAVLGTGLLLAATANVLSRRSLGALFCRSLFYDPRDVPPFYDVGGFPLDRIPLTEDNLADAVCASGAIPLVLRGVRNISGAPPGIYRDGGIIDYHLDLPTSDTDRLTLFPHFFEQLIPGWFDKKLRWRRHSAINTDRTIVICPSAEFIADLPNGKVPDRSDFRTMSPALRRKVWYSVVASCEALAEELHEVLETGRLAARIEPL